MELLKDMFKKGVRDPVAIMNAYLTRGPLRITFGQNLRRKNGPYRSSKMGRVFYDGPHELTCLKWIDTLDGVAAFLPQPMIIVLDDDGHVHYPDFLILFTDGTLEIWEIKDVGMYKEEYWRVEDVSRHELSFYGIGYEVYTNEKVRIPGRQVNCLPTGAYKENVNLFYRYRTHHLDGKEALLDNWPQRESLTFGELKSGVLGRPILLNDLFALVARKQLEINMEATVDDDTLVTVVSKV